MARKLEFDFGGNNFTMAIHKVDRSKLYGRVKTETFDANDKECTLATLARDGRTIIPCLLYTSPSPRDATLSRMPSSA